MERPLGQDAVFYNSSNKCNINLRNSVPGQHIESALSGVAETDRCPGWRTGICVGSKQPVASTPKTETEK